MEDNQKVLSIHANTGFYKVDRYKVGDFFGPIDLGLYLAREKKSLNMGVGLLAGSIFPGSNRLFFTGISPCWKNYYISSMGGAGLVFDNLGINMLSIVGRAHQHSILYLNRVHGEEIQVEMKRINIHQIWNKGRKGVYSLMDYAYECFGDRYSSDPRILAVGPSAESSDFGAIGSVTIKNGKLNNVDTWAGRGGLGTQLFKEHRIVAIVYGGTFIDEDFRDRKVADKWFVNKYQKKLAAKDLEATAKYRYETKFKTGGTFGVNYTTLKGKMFAYNYKSIYATEEERVDMHKNLVLDHYLKQFNEETIDKKQQMTCGEPCVALCKKMNGKFKKDYEPYATMGPLCGIFDQRAAEKLNHHCDMLGFDGISGGSVIAWLMECLIEGHFTKEELGVTKIPNFNVTKENVVEVSMHNAEVGVELFDSIIEKRGLLDVDKGFRKFARDQARIKKNPKILDSFVFIPNGRDGWMVPNQYWVPGALAPMPMMGKYFMVYADKYLTPRELGKQCAGRLIGEMTSDNMGMCRFHRGWSEEMIPEIMDALYGMGDKYKLNLKITAERIISRNASTFWESERTIDYIITFLKRKKNVDKIEDPNLDMWLDRFEKDKKTAALDYWYEIHRGIQETIIM
ncbi:MAG TPA: aldehyde ferredoxin oxidoreductase C-terminal domain-containing protein [Victivallales bacterium]|nr:aldehyde ferredoxin oxidoreductase C-terminal domain-containing protein [Victivallales bacterium]